MGQADLLDWLSCLDSRRLLSGVFVSVQASHSALDMVATAELVRSNNGGCETEGLFQCPKCKGQKTRHFADHKPQGAKSETWGSGRGKDEDVASRTRVTCLNCKHEWRE